MKELSVESPAFENNKFIPAKYTCDGDDVNPPLVIKGIPEEAKTLVLIVDDPDAPMGTWNHWIVWNIQPRGVWNSQIFLQSLRVRHETNSEP